MDVFVPATDSLIETRKLAIHAIRRLAQEILDATPEEHLESDEERSAEIAARVKIKAEELFPEQ